MKMASIEGFRMKISLVVYLLPSPVLIPRGSCFSPSSIFFLGLYQPVSPVDTGLPLFPAYQC